jgi:hypothetical protein
VARVYGKEGTINEGAIGDIPLEQEEWAPEQTAPFRDMVDRGEVEEMDDPKEDPGRTELQIASSLVRHDPLTHPVEAEIAKGLEGREHAIVHTGDPNAKAEEAQPELTEEGRYAPAGGRWDAGEDYTFAGVTKRNTENVKASRSAKPVERSKPDANAADKGEKS